MHVSQSAAPTSPAVAIAPSDLELVMRAQAGDTTALAEIYQRYAALVYRYIYKRVGDAEVAEDLQSEVFVKMLESLPRYEERGLPFSAWLYRIAHSRIIDLIRRRRVRKHVALGDYDMPDQRPSLLHSFAEHEALQQSLATLTNEQRQIIELRFWADLSYAEISARTGRSPQAIKALQHRGLQSIARFMSADTA
ncbi:MAG: hypothetical protein OHK0050_04770 [Roseiflexaceae bacterium]